MTDFEIYIKQHPQLFDMPIIYAFAEVWEAAQIAYQNEVRRKEQVAMREYHEMQRAKDEANGIEKSAK